MKSKILSLVLFLFAFIISINAQQINQISGKCTGTRLVSRINIVAIGDMFVTPCTGRTTFVTGNLDLSGATISGAGFITGSGTATFFPVFTGASAIGNSPYRWTGGIYSWNNTALNATWLMSFVPSSEGVGTYSVGNASTLLSLDEATNVISNQVANATGVWNVTDATNFSLIFNANTNKITANNTTGNNALDFDSTSGTGYFKVGDYTTTPTTYIEQLQTSGITTFRSSATNQFNLTTDAVSCKVSILTADFACQNAAATNTFQFDAGGGSLNAALLNTITLGAPTAISLDSEGSINIGDVNADVNSTIFKVVDSSRTFSFDSLSEAGIFDLDEIINFTLFRTITPAATVGAQTINKPNGTVNFAAASTAIVVTNSVATTASTIIVTQQDTDATCVNFHVDAKANGLFTIRTTAACTAETPVAFWVFN